MRTIGIRELRQHASRYLRAVERGETLQITDRGRPIAQLVPVPDDASPIERLTSEGRLSPAVGDLDDLGDGLVADTSASDRLAAARADER